MSVGEHRVRLTHSRLTEVGPCLDTSTFILKALILPRGALSFFDSAPGAEGAQTRKDWKVVSSPFPPFGCNSSPTAAKADRIGMAVGGRRGWGWQEVGNH